MNVLFVDGDEIREILAHNDPNTAFTIDARHKVAWRYAHLCRWLDRQGLHAVCCTISYFDDVRAFNRAELSEYFEVFLDASLETLARRDKKKIYACDKYGEMKNIVGLDQILSPPSTPDLYIKNDTDLEDTTPIAFKIFSKAMAQSKT